MYAQLSRLPSYRLHKPTGLAVVTLAGRDIYLGRHDTSESRAEYNRLCAEWLATGRRPMVVDAGSGADLSVNEMLLAYLQYAESYYVKNGKPTTEPVNIGLALRPIRELYGHTLAREFGPLRLKTVRQAMINGGLCRTEINKRIRHVVRSFKWAVGEEMVPASLHHGLQAVSGLRRGQSNVRESVPVKPVPDSFVDAIKPHVSRQVWAMVELQRLTGMRPGEVCQIRTCDIAMSGSTWLYVPESHKTEHHGKVRQIPLGPRAREVVQPWLRTELTAYLFSPAEAETERRYEQRANRKTPVQPSQRNRRRRKPRKAPGEKYTVDSYRRAIEYGIKSANDVPGNGGDRAIPHWHPHQIRHSAATRLRKEFDLDTARAVLGHSSLAITEGYAERDISIAVQAMEKIG